MTDIEYTSVVAYLRVSGAEQVKGTGLEGQELDCHAFAQRLGVVIGEELREGGRSGYHANHRKEGAVFHAYEQEVLSGYRRGSLLILSKIDRLSREDSDDAGDLMRLLSRNGVTVATAEDGEIYEAGKPKRIDQGIKLLVKQELAHEESKKKSDRGLLTYDIRQRRAKEGKLALSKTVMPWITVRANKTMVLNDRAPIYAEIFRLSAEEGLGADAIIRRLNADGVKFVSARKEKQASGWHRTAIQKVLTSRAAIGEFQPTRNGKPNGEVWIDHFPRLVSTQMFMKVQETAGMRKRDSSANRNEKVANIFSGLVRCAHCGRNMVYAQSRSAGSVITTKNGSRYSYKRDNGSLVCPTSKHNGCINRKFTAYLTFENVLLTAALHLVMDDQSFARKDEVGRLNILIAEREREHAGAMTAFENLSAAWAERPSELRAKMMNDAEDKVEALAKTVAALTGQREEAKGRVSSQEHLQRVSDIRANLYHEDLAVRLPLRRKVRQAIRNVIHQITIDKDGEATVVFDGGLVAFKIVGKKVLPLGDTIELIKAGVIPLPRSGDQKVQTELMRRMRKASA